MSLRSTMVLELIKQGKTLNQIMGELKISYKSLLYDIREIASNGYKLKKHLFSNGNVIYEVIDELPLPNVREIISNTNNSNFRCLFISDLHTGHILDDYCLIEKIYNYAINNHINYIFILGDVLENTYANTHLRLNTVEKQIAFLIEKYPIDRRIVNLVLYGNHDQYSVLHEGLDVYNIIEHERPDLVSLGDGRAYIKLENDYICLEHYCKNRYNDPELRKLVRFIAIGHSHMYKVAPGRVNEVWTPAVSEANPSNYSELNKPVKGFLDIEFFFEELGLIKQIKINQYIDKYGISLASRTDLRISRKRK